MNYESYIPTFRGNFAGRWFYGRLAEFGKINSVLVDDNNNGMLTNVETDTLSISTGFKDANEQMVYDGDIIEFGTQKRRYLIYWNSENMRWDTELISGNAMQRSDWRCSEYHELGWLAAELPILGECSTKVVGNKWDNSDWLPMNETKNNGMISF